MKRDLVIIEDRIGCENLVRLPHIFRLSHMSVFCVGEGVKLTLHQGSSHLHIKVASRT